MIAGLDLEDVRLSLERAIGRSSLRTVAKAVGMSPTGLTKFLEGAHPYGKTLEKLRRWSTRTELAPAEVAQQLRRLVATLPEPDAGVRNLLNCVDRAYGEVQIPPPESVSSVRALIMTSQR